MEWLCAGFAGDIASSEDSSNITSHLSNISFTSQLYSNGNLSLMRQDNYSHYHNTSMQTDVMSSEPWGYLQWTKKVVIPSLCIFGIVGNLLNIIILSKRIREGVDTMERGALVGMIALAASDFLFCLVTLSGTYLPGARVINFERNYVFYYTLYGNCIQNILIKTSTWLTVILAGSRYFVVTNPIKARQYMRCGHTLVAIVTCIVIWTLLHIPLTWIWQVMTLDCGHVEIYILHPGAFEENKNLHTIFTCIWAVLGFILPIIVLLFCNLKLIYSLNLSRRLRKRSQEGQRLSNQRSEKSRGNPRLITITLIAIVTTFFVLVLPSEVVLFYGDLAQPNYNGSYRIFLLTSNLLQAFNFSMNFALYCLVNQYFRKTLKLWIHAVPIIGKVCISRDLDEYLMGSFNRSQYRSHSMTTKQTTITRNSSRSSSIGSSLMYNQSIKPDNPNAKCITTLNLKET